MDEVFCAEVNSSSKPRRKPNRWGLKAVVQDQNPVPVPASISEGSVPVSSAGLDVKKPRKSRFSSELPAASTVAHAQFGGLTKQKPLTHHLMQQTVLMQMKLKLINDKISNVAQDAVARDKNPDRSPSPPPKYDANGKRVNTTEVWMRESLMQDRNEQIEDMIKVNPHYVPPADYVKPKPFRMLRIPQKEFPNYNFIGLIIGPRGNTQKRMEMETGTKISIRGKGSVKEGSKNRANKFLDESDDLHVHITGDDEEKVILASKMVAELLCPVDDDKNEHKQKQLKELALINGTLKEDEFCPECGERGHRHFECPQRIKTFKNAGVKCSICGDMSHPTRDCPMKERGVTNEVVLDSEYDSFMSELGGKAKESTVVTATVAAIAPKKAQTVVHLGSVMTGLPPTAFTPAAPVYAAPIPWMPGVPLPAPTPPPLYTYPTNPYAGYIPQTMSMPSIPYAPAVPMIPVVPLPPVMLPQAPPPPPEELQPGDQYSMNEMD